MPVTHSLDMTRPARASNNEVVCVCVCKEQTEAQT